MSLLAGFCWLGSKPGNGFQWPGGCWERAFGLWLLCLAWHGSSRSLTWYLTQARGFFFVSGPYTRPAALQTPVNFGSSWRPAVTRSTPHLWEELLQQVWKLTCFVEHPLPMLKEISTLLSPPPSPRQDLAYFLLPQPKHNGTRVSTVTSQWCKSSARTNLRQV